MTGFPEEDADCIRDLAALLEETGLNEISVRRAYGDGTSLAVRVSRGAGMAAAAPQHPTESPSPETTPESTDSINAKAVPSPMVGTAYLAPEPGATPYIQVGDPIHEGQTLLIIDAMKTMNAIPSPRSGIVQRILVTDGEAVEYGTPLVILD